MLLVRKRVKSWKKRNTIVTWRTLSNLLAARTICSNESNRGSYGVYSEYSSYIQDWCQTRTKHEPNKQNFPKLSRGWSVIPAFPFMLLLITFSFANLNWGLKIWRTMCQWWSHGFPKWKWRRRHPKIFSAILIALQKRCKVRRGEPSTTGNWAKPQISKFPNTKRRYLPAGASHSPLQSKSSKPMNLEPI